MDKNQVIGIVLISSMLLIYLFTNQNKDPEVIGTTTELSDSSVTASSNIVNEAPVPDTSKALLPKTHDTFASVVGTEEEVKLENENIEVILSSKGGKVKEVRLKNYTDFQNKELVLLSAESSKMNLKVGEKDLYNYLYEVEKGKNSVTFSLTTNDGKKIKQKYVLPEDGFLVDYSIKTFGGLSGTTELHWDNKLILQEKSLSESSAKSAINYFTKEGDYDDVGKDSKGEKSELVEERLQWIAMKNRFFNAAIIGKNFSFEKADLKTSVNKESKTSPKQLTAKISIPSSSLGDAQMQFYFGPNDYKITKATEIEGFQKNVYLGWPVFAFMNRNLIIPIFKFLENYFGNYGIIILILVIIIKLILFPIAYRSYLSMAKMRELKPEIDKIKEQVGDDTQMVQKETMSLYKKVGVNPLSGCIPVLLQMPILIALFNFFPNSIELRHQAFLWADDLSSYDAIFSWSGNIPLLSSFYGNHVSLFTLLMTASTLIYTYINNKGNTQAQGPMKNIGYIMPVMFMFVLNRYSSGLTYYYFVSNLITISQQLLATKFIDKDKIRETLQANKQAFDTGKRKKIKVPTKA